MALESKSIDEFTEDLADHFDSLIEPERIWRNNNNKIHLMLRAYAKGHVGINDVVIALRNRFNPALCDEMDLRSVASLVGTELRKGSGSILDITIVNTDTEQRVLRSGVYNYQSSIGEVFSFELTVDRVFDPDELFRISAISENIGSFEVSEMASIDLYRSDNDSIDPSFAFSCAGNEFRLGYEDETLFEFRNRILNDADRQDHLKELELAIRNLPNIFECNLIMNTHTADQAIDGIVMRPREVLIAVTGTPTNQMADVFAEKVFYTTCKVDPDDVVYYENDLILGGRYPVYFTYHKRTDFSLRINYRYDHTIMRSELVEETINALFRPYRQMVTHMDIFSERDAYKVLENLNLPNLKILDVNVLDGEGNDVSFVEIPRTRLPNLTSIQYIPSIAGADV